MAPPREKEDANTSYVEVTTTTAADAGLIGAHCALGYCNQLDFLPFLCQSCRQTFCLDHRSETAHACARAGAWAERRRQAALARPSAGAGRPLRDAAVAAPRPCAAPACAITIGTGLVPGVLCAGCSRAYCLKHRLRDDHDCARVAPAPHAGAGAAPGRADLARGALEKLRLWGAAKKEAASRVLPRARPSSAAARVAATNALKKTAKGDAKVPPEKRVYVYVEAEAETAKAKIPKGEFFYSRDWVVGRLLDAAAKSLQVQNINNQSADERDRLRLFHVEGGRVLDFNEKIGSALVSGNTVVLLRGVGPPPDLIQV
ncbi:hypothetical protein P8C59_003005 [Phyllachora maydis]|uniref:AN1-type domain-containing protein n=1 Tax=Phyllachora maydis TaxID=1825666 RepID=A0AAD9I0K0_9PEZI|nr:hypothetical protein P8C59_003005 [Phyllachora maydis]